MSKSVTLKDLGSIYAAPAAPSRSEGGAEAAAEDGPSLMDEMMAAALAARKEQEEVKRKKQQKAAKKAFGGFSSGFLNAAPKKKPRKKVKKKAKAAKVPASAKAEPSAPVVAPSSTDGVDAEVRAAVPSGGSLSATSKPGLVLPEVQRAMGSSQLPTGLTDGSWVNGDFMRKMAENPVIAKGVCAGARSAMRRARAHRCDVAQACGTPASRASSPRCSVIRRES